MIAALVVFVSVYLAVRALMVELLQNLQDVYSKWEGKWAGPHQHSALSPESNHAGMGDTDRTAPTGLFPRKPNTVELNPNKFGIGVLRVSKLGHMYRTKLPLVDEEMLVPYKLYPPTGALRQSQTLRSLALQCCSRCMPMSKSSFGVDETVTLLGLENVLNLPHNGGSRFVPFKFIKNSLYLTCKSVPHEHKVISQKIVESESVKRAMENAVSEDPGTDENEHKLRAVSILERMKAAISTVLLRFAVWLMHRIMARMLSGLYVPRGQIELIKQASKHNVPMIYLPLHRSHLDYIVVTFLLYINEVKVPLVAAGDNLLIPLFGTLLRGLGGFFIKRRLDFKDGRKDYVYRAILKEYMTEILKANHSVEFFIEGGRSRTGKTRLPKVGLLSLIVNCLNEELVRDVYIVPISISYEKILDGNFVSEQLGEAKVMESFTATLRSIWHILHSNYGNVRIDFCQPFSLREFLMSSKVRTMESTIQACPLPVCSSWPSDMSFARFHKSSSCNSLSSNDSTPEDQRHVIQSLANHVIYQSSKSLALMSTNLVALLFLTKHRKGGTLQQLVHSLSWLRSEVFQREHQVMCDHDNAEVVRQASSLLSKDLVHLETIQMEWSSEGATENNNLRIVFYRPTLRLPHVLELQYYANAALPVFLNESIAATAVYAIAGEKLTLFRGSDGEVVFPRSQLAARIELLFNVLQFEFILTLPCRNSHTIIDDTIDKLVNGSLLSICMDPMNYASTHHRKWASSVATTLGWEQDLKTPFSNEQQLKVVLTEDSLGMLEFLRSVLASYVEAYWVVACSLLKLVNKQMEEKMFFQEIQKVAQDRLHQGLLCFEESFAAETLRNAVKLFEQWKIIEHHGQDYVRILYLGERWNSDNAVDSVVTLIGDFKT